MDKDEKRCTRCILPASYPNLSFNNQGICSKCSKKGKTTTGINFKDSEKIVQKLISNIKRKKATYDCVIGLSGGKDSSYVAYLSVKKYQMKPLCVTFDNGLLTEGAKSNIKNLVNYLNADHIFYKVNNDLTKRLMRHFLITTGEFCTPCNIGIGTATLKTALNYNIPSILTGYSPYTDADADIHIFSSWPEYFHNVAKGHFTDHELKEIYFGSSLARAWSYRIKNITSIDMPKYIEWKESEFIDILRQEVGWNPGKEEHFDCIAAPLKEYLRIKEFGFSEKAMKYSKLIRSGNMTREKALCEAEAFETKMIGAEKEYKQLIKRLFDVSEDELDKAILKRQDPYIPKSAVLVDYLRTNDFISKLARRY